MKQTKTAPSPAARPVFSAGGLEGGGCFRRAVLELAIPCLALLLAGGCAVYRPKPLTRDAVQAELRPPPPAELQLQAGRIKHPILRPVKLRPDAGLTPDSAAILAVLLNPSLRAVRDRRGESSAQLLDARLLPNPELTAGIQEPIGGNTTGAVTAYGLGLNWDVTSLLSRAAKVAAAQANHAAVDLEIGWQEWQVAEAAKAAVYKLVSLRQRVALAEQTCRRGAQDLAHVQKAVEEGTVTAAALQTARTATSRAAETLLSLRKRADRQRLQLKRLLGLSGDAPIHLDPGIRLPARIEPPARAQLLAGLEQRRLDLLALRRGYDSQEAAVRAAVLEQFPRIGIGPTMGRDTDTVQTVGLGLSIQLPIFNRGQAHIALEKATRKRLFDEYASRVFDAHSDIDMILSDIRYTDRQIAAAQMAEKDQEKLEADYRAALADGRADAMSWYAAWDSLANTRLKISALKEQLAQAAVALQLASGLYELPAGAGAGKDPE